MTDKNKFGNNAETPASDLPAELVEQLKGQRADKTPVLKQKFNTQNPPKESGQYPAQKKQSEIINSTQEKIKKTFDPRERQVISSPLKPQTTTPSKYAANDIEERESLYPATFDVFAELERERDEVSKRFPRTPAPEPGKDTDYPEKADTGRPPRPGFAVPSTIEELKAEEARMEEKSKQPTPVPPRKSPVPNGSHRKVSGQYAAQNIHDDALHEGTPRFAAPRVPNLNQFAQSSQEVVQPETIGSSEEVSDTIIDDIISHPKTK